jgi:hypothetical protein
LPAKQGAAFYQKKKRKKKAYRGVKFLPYAGWLDRLGAKRLVSIEIAKSQCWEKILAR